MVRQRRSTTLSKEVKTSLLKPSYVADRRAGIEIGRGSLDGHVAEFGGRTGLKTGRGVGGGRGHSGAQGAGERRNGICNRERGVSGIPLEIP